MLAVIPSGRLKRTRTAIQSLCRAQKRVTVKQTIDTIGMVGTVKQTINTIGMVGTEKQTINTIGMLGLRFWVLGCAHETKPATPANRDLRCSPGFPMRTPGMPPRPPAATRSRKPWTGMRSFPSTRELRKNGTAQISTVQLLLGVTPPSQSRKKTYAKLLPF